jgi:spore photoproduct lyase
MDTAKTFAPNTISLWKAVADHSEARKIIGMFPQARTEIVERQSGVSIATHPSKHPTVFGKRVLMIGATSSFVRCFDGHLGGDVCCAPYFKLVPVSNGCPYYCTYCYLAYVYREYLPFLKMNVNYDRMLNEIRQVVANAPCAASFNMGEMLDSLALDHINHLTEKLVPCFSRLAGGSLMLLTKSSNVGGLLSVTPNSRTVVSWSLNAQRMIEAYEAGTAHLDDRIDAARRCQGHGYRLRLRIDPGILYPDWRAGYAELVHRALTILHPEDITLGMLRLLGGHLRLIGRAYGPRGRKLQAMRLSDRGSDGKRRYSPVQRVEFYRFLIDRIRDHDKRVSIGLCRETADVWNVLRDQCDSRKCNCLIWA